MHGAFPVTGGKVGWSSGNTLSSSHTMNRPAHRWWIWGDNVDDLKELSLRKALVEREEVRLARYWRWRRRCFDGVLLVVERDLVRISHRRGLHGRIGACAGGRPVKLVVVDPDLVWVLY